MNVRTLRRFVALLLGLAVAPVASAQDSRIPFKLDPASTAAINAVLDSAVAMGIPTAPLREKVYEGMGKGADGPRIVAAVRTLAADMARAHRALGTVATTDEIKAGASAMHAGVSAVELGQMKKQGGLRRSLTLPFTVLADIVSRGVPVRTAANAIRSLVGAGAKDQDINDFQKKVKDDIDSGAPPAAAVETRAKGAVNEKPKPESPDTTIRLDF